MNDYKVYKHTTPNGKIYIGITCKKKCEYRWNNGNGYWQNDHFYKAIKKYGWDQIKHEILFSDLTREEAEAKEVELIRMHKSNDPRYGYNHMAGGDVSVSKHSQESIEKMRVAHRGKKASPEERARRSEAMKGRSVPEETRRKISEAQIGKPKPKHTEEWKKMMSERQIDKAKNMRAICQYTLAGEFVARYISAQNAQRKTGFDNRNVIACCRGKKKSAYGYVWKYAEAII